MKFTIGFLLLLCAGFAQNSQAKSCKLSPGHWHLEFTLNDSTNLPVTLLLEGKKSPNRLTIINADEYFELDNIRVEKDSFFIHFGVFDSEIRGKRISKNHITGAWYNHAKKGNYFIPFWAKNEHLPRFKHSESNIDIIGKWETHFSYQGNEDIALGIFESNPIGCSESLNPNLIKGTFLTETGDYRFLEGVVSNDSLYLSTFDGSHAFLFKAVLVNDTLWGDFYSGTHYHTNWYAVKNNAFKLSNPDSLTYIVNDKPFEFTLQDLNQKSYQFPNPEINNKVVLVQLMGSWCPNCMDESRYLKRLKNKHGDALQIISVAFETPKSIEGKIERVRQFKETLDLDFTFLIGGDASKKQACEVFPMLNEIISFPTLVFIDKQGKVRNIHTGFSGPGTGIYYDNFVEKTDKFVQQLINE